jgi:hypothetical protein
MAYPIGTTTTIATIDAVSYARGTTTTIATIDARASAAAAGRPIYLIASLCLERRYPVDLWYT